MLNNANALISVNEGIIALDIKNSLKNLGFNVELTPKDKIIDTTFQNEFPDLLIIDIDFLTAFQVNQIIRFYTIFDISIILITGKNESVLDGEIYNNEKVFFLLKPFDAENLNLIVKNAFNTINKTKAIPSNKILRSKGQYY